MVDIEKFFEGHPEGFIQRFTYLFFAPLICSIQMKDVACG